ncbi:DUF2845 domain-containing protein [Dyella kyungheensis]|uniref:DUF2845 domain-containing protein n=1 Tax=Dyella kyungheensis TaxID=1242174 RepID=UPI003CE9948F
MRSLVVLLLGLLMTCLAHAGSGTLRVGSQVLVVGDSAARVVELLGKPVYRSHAKPASGSHGWKRKGGHRSSSAGGEQWQYRQGRRIVTIVVADGKVASIRDDGS